MLSDIRQGPVRRPPGDRPVTEVKLGRPSEPLLEGLDLEDGRGMRLVGELDLSTADDLPALLTAVPGGARVVDVAELSFMDVSGLHAFEEYARTLDGSGPLVLENVSTQMRRVFEMTPGDHCPHIELRSDPERG